MAPAKPKEPAASSKSGTGVKSGTVLNPDVEMHDPAAAQQGVSKLAEELLGLFNRFPAEMASACERRILDHNVEQPIARDIKTFLSKFKGADHANFVELLDKLVQMVPSEKSAEHSKTSGRCFRSVNVRDLVENLRSDVNDSLVEIVDCLAKELNLTEEQLVPIDQKKMCFLVRNNAALDGLEADLKEKLEKEDPVVQFEVGRETLEADTDFFGFTGEQELVQERDQLKAKVKLLQMDLDQCKQHAEGAHQSTSRRLEALGKATKLVKCEEQELVAKVASLMKCKVQAQAESHMQELKIQELEHKLQHANTDVLQDSHERIVFLEQQLQQLTLEVTTLRTENEELQDLADAFKALEMHETPSGTRPSLKDRIEALGFYKDNQGRLQRRAQPIHHKRFCTAVPYAGSTRYS